MDKYLLYQNQSVFLQPQEQLKLQEIWDKCIIVIVR